MARATLFVSLFSLLALACSDDDKGSPPNGDQTLTGKDIGPDMAISLASCTGCLDYVLDRVWMPKTSADVEACAVDHKGKRYNALGWMMIPLLTVIHENNTQDLPDEAIYSGDALNLLRIKAKDPTNDPGASAQLWPAKKVTCCSTPKDLIKCAAQAKTKCFSGTGAFTPDPTAAATTAVAGSVLAGKLALGPGEVLVRFPIPGMASLDIPVSVAKISGSLSSAALVSGCLSGAIFRPDITKVLVPRLRDWINANYKSNPNVKTQKQLRDLFDTNKDGMIDNSEFMNNGMLKMLTQGDVDLDGDGAMDMTLGFRFSAAKATINP